MPKNKKTQKMGRPRKNINVKEIKRLHEEGFSYRKIAEKIGNISYMTVSRRLKN